MNPANQEICCDGCGVVATDEHLRRRVERLELATRFRPIHIETLIVYPAPPEPSEDYFYKPGASRDERSAHARAFFDALTGAFRGVENSSAAASEETLLAEFQRAGCFLAGCSECPLEETSISTTDLVGRLAPSLVRRVQYSYKPKQTLLLSNELASLIPFLQQAGFEEKLLLRDGAPIEIPAFKDPAAIVRFRTDVRAVLAKTRISSGAGQKA
ncbi:MAG: hypothetical protein ACYDCD_00845 [Candidatus Acidiferrales bacterium]